MKQLEELLFNAHTRYPLSQAEDYYKLLYQSCFGPRHLLHSTRMMKQFFMQEWDTLLLTVNNNHREIATMEDVSLFYPLARIHFHPAIQEKITPDNVFNAFLITISKFQPVSMVSFQETLLKSEKILLKKPFSLSKDSIAQVWQNGITDPPNSVHHSALFNETYHPHYRIVIPSLLAEVFGTGEIKSPGSVF